MAGITVACTHCGTQLKLKDDSLVGKSAPCPKCKQKFVIEAMPEEAADDDFDMGGDDDFGDMDDAPAPKSKKKEKSAGGGKAGAGKKDKGKAKGKGKKGAKSGGSMLPLFIGGGVLVLLLGVGGLLWGLGVFGGGEADAPVVAGNATAGTVATDPATAMTDPATATPAGTPAGGHAASGSATPTATATGGPAGGHGDPMSPEAMMANSVNNGSSAPAGHGSSQTGDATSSSATPAGHGSPMGAVPSSASPPAHGAPAGATTSGTTTPTGTPMSPAGSHGSASISPADMMRMQASANGSSVPPVNGLPGAGNPARPPLPPMEFNITPGEYKVPQLDSLLPDTDAVVYLQVQHLLASPLVQQLINMERQKGNDPLGEFERALGLPLADVESVTIAWADLAEFSKKQQAMQQRMMQQGATQSASGAAESSSTNENGTNENGDAIPPSAAAPGAGPSDPPPQAPPMVLLWKLRPGVELTSIKPYMAGETVANGGAAYRRMQPSAPPQTGGQPGFGPPPAAARPMAAVPFDETTLLIGEEQVIVELLKQTKPWSPGLQEKFGSRDFKHQVTMLVDYARLKDANTQDAPVPEQFQKLNELMLQHGTDMGFTLDLNADVALSLIMGTDDGTAAESIAGEVKAALSAAKGQLAGVGLLFPGLKSSVTSLIDNTVVTSNPMSVSLELRTTQPEIEKLTSEVQKAASVLFASAMAAGPGAGGPGAGSVSIGEEIIQRGVEPTEVTGLPEGWQLRAQVGWHVATSGPQKTEVLEPMIEVVAYEGDAAKVAAYRATENLPDRSRNAPKIGEIVVDRTATGEQPPQGALTKFYPRISGEVPVVMSVFEGTLLLRIPKKSEVVKVARVVAGTEAVEHPLARQLTMRVGKPEQGQGLRLTYKAKSNAIVGSIEVLDAAGTPIPGVVATEEDVKGTTVVTFAGQIPAEAGLRINLHSELEVVKATFKFTDLPVPPKPEDTKLFAAQQLARRYPNRAAAGNNFGATGFEGQPGFPGSATPGFPGSSGNP